MLRVIEFLNNIITIGLLSIIAMGVWVVIVCIVIVFVEITFEKIKQRFFK